MKTLSKTQYIYNWLDEGKKIRQHQAKVMFNAERLASIINRFRKRYSDRWIINVGEKGKHANYMMIKRGRYLKTLIKGYRLTFQNVEYVRKNGLIVDADILLTCDNGTNHFQVMACEGDFRRTKNGYEELKRKINESRSK